MFTSPPVWVHWVQSTSMRLSVSWTAYVCPLASQKSHALASLNVLYMYVIRGRGSVLLWRQCNMLCTSGFVDDVMLR